MRESAGYTDDNGSGAVELNEDYQQLITGVDETENTDIQQLKEELEFVQLAVNQRDNFRIRENVSLPAGKPEIQEIIW